MLDLDLMMTTMVTLLWLTGGALSYEWGNDDEIRYQRTSDYDGTVIIPDQERPAQHNGTVQSLRLYSTENDVSIRLLLLHRVSLVPEITYRVQQRSYDLPIVTGQATHSLAHLKMSVTVDDVVAFAMSTRTPMPYDPKVPCEEKGMLQVHHNSTDLRAGSTYTFRRSPQGHCLKFSYVLDVQETDLATFAPRREATEEKAESDDHISQRETPQTNKDSCYYTNNCDQHDLNYGAQEDDTASNLFRYVIFGPLIVLWIIVSILCTLKVKRRCCARSAPVVTPTAHQRRAPPEQPARQPRFARITLSRVPPQPAATPQPKPILTPSAALPPYVADAYMPSEPPPAYTAKDDTKADDPALTTDHMVYTNPCYTSDLAPDPPGETVWPAAYIPAAQYTATQSPTTQQYPDPPPPYQANADSQHI